MNKTLIRPNWLEVSPRKHDFLWLDKNENTDIEYLNFIKKKVEKNLSILDYSTYPDLKEIYLKLSNLEKVNPENLLLTTGSDGAIRTVFQTYISPGDMVFITNPSFAMYDIYCKLQNAKIHYIEYINKNNIIEFDFEQLLENIKFLKPKLICIPNPDSPTGSTLSKLEINTLLIECRKYNTILFIDEAYYPFYDNTSLNFCSEYENLIICRTFSKAWGLAGIRVGFLISSNKQISYMNLGRPMYEIGSIQLKIISDVLDNSQEMLESVQRLLEGKNYFEQEMRKLKFETLNTFGNFSHVNFGIQRDKITRELDKFILYRKKFDHPSLLNYSRFSSAPVSIMKNVVNKINKIYENL
jgi:histidinol-phosphate aminotransferase